MIEYIKLNNVGPAKTLSVDLGSRLNIFTGDNGLGKTFLLDIAWWILTDQWSKHAAHPHDRKFPDTSIKYKTSGNKAPFTSIYFRNSQTWDNDEEHRMKNGMVLYSRVDGEYSFFDSVKIEYQKQEKIKKDNFPEVLNFSNKDIWEGLNQNGNILCNGVIQDWITWQFRKTDLFSQFEESLINLSPSAKERLRPGQPARVFIEDSREFPTLEFNYGVVPVPHFAASIRRIIEMAYLLVWAFNENQQISSLMQATPAKNLVLLIDEIETHLHPQWQRVFLPALLKTIQVMQPDLNVQMIVTTHSPLVLASTETSFIEETDRLFNFELDVKTVKLNEIGWAKQGDAVGWLTSNVFGLHQARSKEAEVAIEAAESFMRKDFDSLPDDLKTKNSIHKELLRVLPGHDIFWPRWIVANKDDFK